MKSKKMTRKQLVSRIKKLIGPNSSGLPHFAKVKIAPGLDLEVEMRWECDDEPTCEFDILGYIDFRKMKRKFVVDWSKVVDFRQHILDICKESDRQAKECGQDPGEYWDEIRKEIEMAVLLRRPSKER